MNHMTLIGFLLVVIGTAVINAEDDVSVSLDVDEESRVDRLFQVFKETFDKKYDNVFEHLYRRSIFQDNLQYIEEHNRQFAQGKYSYTLGVNEFADLKHEEFLELYTSRVDMVTPTNTSTKEPHYSGQVPDVVDWRTQGYVTAVKNQGQCGSCWAFSTTGSLEGQYAKKTRQQISLSEQQLVDCSINYGNQGCNGGLMTKSFQYIKAVGGIESEQDYPYTARRGNCRFSPSLARARVSGYISVSQDETSLKTTVALVGPISVAIDASQRSFQLYDCGIYNEPMCSSVRLNHAVLVVGYGTSKSDFWIVKNSWGTNWGEEGYIRMSRNRQNQCGIASMACYPTIP